MNRTLLWVIVGATAALLGCTFRGSARALRSGDGRVAPSVSRVPNGASDEAILGLPDGALTSEASLVTLDDKGACFDVLVRTPPRTTTRSSASVVSARATGAAAARDLALRLRQGAAEVVFAFRVESG